MATTKKPDPSTMDLPEIIARFNSGPRTDAMWDRLDKLTEGRSVLKLNGSNLDASGVEKALAFSRRTGKAAPGHKTARDLRAELTHEHDEADPLTGEPLFEGQTGDGADWSQVSKDDRAAVALGVLQGEVGLRGKSSEEVIHLITTGAPPIPRLQRAWRDLPLTDLAGEMAAKVRARLIAKPTAQEESRPFADATPAQMLGQRCAADGLTSCHGNRHPCGLAGMVGDCGRAIPVNPRGPIVIPADGPSVRRALEATFRTDSDFNAFVQDCFPEAHKRLSDGMDRTAKVNLLLKCADPTDIGIALSRRR